MVLVKVCMVHLLSGKALHFRKVIPQTVSSFINIYLFRYCQTVFLVGVMFPASAVIAIVWYTARHGQFS